MQSYADVHKITIRAPHKNLTPWQPTKKPTTQSPSSTPNVINGSSSTHQQPWHTKITLKERSVGMVLLRTRPFLLILLRFLLGYSFFYHITRSWKSRLQVMSRTASEGSWTGPTCHWIPTSSLSMFRCYHDYYHDSFFCLWFL